jgi:hypothetical protein
LLPLLLSQTWCPCLKCRIRHCRCAHWCLHLAGYLTLKEVFSFGALMSVVNLCVWGVVGGAWWKFMGFF